MGSILTYFAETKGNKTWFHVYFDNQYLSDMFYDDDYLGDRFSNNEFLQAMGICLAGQYNRFKDIIELVNFPIGDNPNFRPMTLTEEEYFLNGLRGE